MAASVIGALRAVLGLDTAQFEQGADRARGKGGQLKAAIGEIGASLAEMAAPAALATAGVAAFAKGMELAKASLDFADELDATATKIGITASSLQTLRFAAQDADIDAATFDASIASLNATLGALQSGIGDGKIRKAFEALGIPQSQIESMRDASDLLPVLADAIGKAGTQAEQVQIAKKLGVEDLLPLLQRGADGIKALEEQARSLGVVLDDSVTTKMADLSRELEITELRSKAAGDALGFALAPMLIAAKNAAADLLIELTSIIERFEEIEQRSSLGLTRQRENAYWKMSTLLQGAKGNTREGLDWFGRAQYDAAKKRYDEAQAELDRRRFTPQASTPASARAGASGTVLTPTERATARAKGSAYADEFDKARQIREEANARKALTDKINAEAIGPVIATEADRINITEPISNAVADGVGQGLLDARNEVYEGYRDAFAGALDAGIRGGSRGVLEWLGMRFQDALVKAMADALAAKAAASTGNSVIKGLAMVFGVGQNAAGTPNWRGGLTLVGEKGPELLNVPAGSSITPNHALAGALGGVSQHFHINAQGAVLAEGLIAEMRAVGAQAAVAGARGGAAITDDRLTRRSRKRFK